MAGGQSLRKYIGAIKDTTTVSLAKVNSDYKELDIPIVRATNHHERPAKEKNIRAIFFAISASRPRGDVAYCIHALVRRLSKTRNWAVALKTLIVIHRALREADPTFREELINYGRNRNYMLNLAHFKDDSSPSAWDYSAWVRSYSLFLEERLECFRVLKYDVETDPPRTRDLEATELVEHLLSLQQLLHRLLGCLPQGAAVYNFVIQLAFTMIAEEGVRIYNAISDGIINLIDKFFEMERHNAVRALEIYKRAGHQAERLSEFFEVCTRIDLRRGQKFVKIEQPPASFVTAMEDYLSEDPHASPACKEQAVDENLPAPDEEVLEIEDNETPDVETPASPPPPEAAKEEPPVHEECDFLGLSGLHPDASELDYINALALDIIPADAPQPAPSSNSFTPTGWELAIVPVSGSNGPTAATKPDGMDKFTLDSLYDDANRGGNQVASYNPWSSRVMQPIPHDHFYTSGAVQAPHAVHMAAMAQHQHALMLHQQMSMMGQQPHLSSGNPFANPYMAVGGHSYGVGMHFQAYNAYTGLL